MGHGGARVGAGRKPREKARVLGMNGTRMSPNVDATTKPSSDHSNLADPPDGLPIEQHEFWRRWAPMAIEMRTLAPSTVVGFRELCEQMALKVAIWDRMAQLGLASSEADRLLKRYEKIAQRLDTSLKGFKLTAFGKPVEGAAPRQAKVNPWAQVR